MKRNGCRAEGFTLVELLVTIAIVVALASLVFVMSSRAMGRAKLTGSIAKARDLGMMVVAYSGDRNGELPVWHDYTRSMYWWQLVTEETGVAGREETLFKSPNHREFDKEAVAQTISYGWNYPVIGRHKGDSAFSVDHFMRMANFGDPSRVLVFCDGARTNSWGFVDPYQNQPDPERYEGKAAAFFLDGSVRVLDTPDEFGTDSEWFVPVKALPIR